jgi:hypothetical protein
MVKLWDHLYIFFVTADTSLVMGWMLLALRNSGLPIAGEHAVICFPLSLDLSDGLNVDVVGSDVLGLAHRLEVDGLRYCLDFQMNLVRLTLKQSR